MQIHHCWIWQHQTLLEDALVSLSPRLLPALDPPPECEIFQFNILAADVVTSIVEETPKIFVVPTVPPVTVPAVKTILAPRTTTPNLPALISSLLSTDIHTENCVKARSPSKSNSSFTVPNDTYPDNNAIQAMSLKLQVLHNTQAQCLAQK